MYEGKNGIAKGGCGEILNHCRGSEREELVQREQERGSREEGEYGRLNSGEM